MCVKNDSYEIFRNVASSTAVSLVQRGATFSEVAAAFAGDCPDEWIFCLVDDLGLSAQISANEASRERATDGSI